LYHQTKQISPPETRLIGIIMTTIKAISVEGNLEFENYSHSELFYGILNSFFAKKEEIYDSVSERIGKKLESDIYDPFNIFVSYENEDEIQKEVDFKTLESGYSREITEEGYNISTPTHSMTVFYGSDFGGTECVKQIVTINIESK